MRQACNVLNLTEHTRGDPLAEGTCLLVVMPWISDDELDRTRTGQLEQLSGMLGNDRHRFLEQHMFSTCQSRMG